MTVALELSVTLWVPMSDLTGNYVQGFVGAGDVDIDEACDGSVGGFVSQSQT